MVRKTDCMWNTIPMDNYIIEMKWQMGIMLEMKKLIMYSITDLEK